MYIKLLSVGFYSPYDIHGVAYAMIALPTNNPEAGVRLIRANKSLSGFLKVWLKAHNSCKTIPRTADINIIALGRSGLLPFVHIVERVCSGNLVCRLAGEAITVNFPANPRGQPLRAMFDSETYPFIEESYGRVIRDTVAHYSAGRVYRGDVVIYHSRRLMLPLANPQGSVNRVIAVVAKSLEDTWRPVAGTPRYEIRELAYIPIASLDAATPEHDGLGRAGRAM